MRKLASACICLLGVLGASDSSMAQNRMSDVPEAFFGAQRGRVVAHRHGGFRMHYGRGLTPAGASVINTGITTLGPLLPGIIGVPGAALVPAPGAALEQPQAAPTPAAAPGCETDSYLPPDQVLDSLASVSVHEQRIKHLDDMLCRLKPVVEGFGGTFEQGTPVPVDGGTGTTPPTTKLEVRPGDVVSPPGAPQSAPSAQPTSPCPPAPTPPVPTAPVPTAPVPTAPVPTAPVPTPPVPTPPAPVPSSEPAPAVLPTPAATPAGR